MLEKNNKESNIKVNDIITILDEKRNKWRLGKIEKLTAGKGTIIRRAEVKVAKQNKKPTVIMRSLQKLFPLEMNKNETRPSSNPKMKKTDALSKQIQKNEKKEDNDVNNNELFQRSPKNLKQSDMEPLNHGDGNENVNDRSKCNRPLS